jgi:hypothetical protein
VLPGGDELLDAAEDVVVAVAVGARRDRAGVGAYVRLGQAEAAQRLAARQRNQPAGLLRVGAVGVDRSAHHRVLHADDGARRAVAGGDFLERQREGHVVHAGAAPALGHDHSQRAQFAQRREFRARKVVFAVPARRVGRELLLRERAHGVADQGLFFGQQHGKSGVVGRSVAAPGLDGRIGGWARRWGRRTGHERVRRRSP